MLPDFVFANRAMPMVVSLKRVYEKASPADGRRVLVDRLWPRGLSKHAAAIDAWLRDLAPSDGLRTWYHARPECWVTFRKRYLAELGAEKASGALEELYRMVAGNKAVTLLFASRHTDRNNATILKELLEGMRKPPSTSGPARAAAGRVRARISRRR
jgi:uncharacterized protein YeaO (DUF488 family)